MNDAPSCQRAAHLIAVGDELLLGRTADTNSQEVARALASHGISVTAIAVVPDDKDAIAAALDRTVPGALVFLSGGLGPTPDDLTREAVAAWAAASLVEDPVLADLLRTRCQERGFPYREGVARQARVPEGLGWIANPAGSAPGLVGELRGRTLVLLPGVPSELRALLPLVLERLLAAGRLPEQEPAVLVRTAQLVEAVIAEGCAPLMTKHPGLRWSWWLVPYGVDVRISSPAAGRDDAVRAAGEELRAHLGRYVYASTAGGAPAPTLVEVVQAELIRRGRTLGVAESCTAGLLAGRLTEAAGASACFRGGVISYADAVKRELLGVPEAMLAAHGAVSHPVAEAMARGCRRRLGVDIGLAVTGIAGPGGGSVEKPVGTTWIAVATERAVHARCHRFPGSRSRNRNLAVAVAIDTVRRLLEAGDDVSPWLTGDAWSPEEPS